MASLVNVQTGGPFSSIQAAVNDLVARPAATYELRVLDSDTYLENVDVAVPWASATYPVTIRPDTGQIPVVDGSGGDYCVQLGSSGIVLEDLRLQNWGVGATRAAVRTGTSAIDTTILRRCAFDFSVAGDHGIVAQPLTSTFHTELFVDACTFTNTPVCFLRLESCNNTTLQAMTFADWTLDALYLEAGSGWDLRDLVFQNGYRGVKVEYAGNVRLVNCLSYGLTAPFVSAYGDASRGLSLKHCLASGTGPLLRAEGFSIATAGGISILNSQWRVRDGGFYAYDLTIPASALAANYNVYSRETIAAANVALLNGTPYQTLGDWQTGSGKDANSRAADGVSSGLFINESLSNYHPAPGSTALAFCPALGIAEDLDGVARPAGLVDAGPYTYDATNLTAWNTHREVAQWRCEPTGGALVGDFSFVLGHDQAGWQRELNADDYIEVYQDVDLTGVTLIRAAVRVVGPLDVPTGYTWKLQLRVAGTVYIERAIPTGAAATESWTDLGAGVKQLSGSQNVAIRLVLEVV